MMTVQQNCHCQHGKILPLYQASGNGSGIFTKQVLCVNDQPQNGCPGMADNPTDTGQA